MSAHRRVRTHGTKVRRTITAAILAVASGVGFVVAAGPASAAGPWFVKTAALGGNNAAACTTPATACATISGVLAKAGFVSGDTINVAAGTYVDRPIFSTKGANVVGAGTNALTGTVIANNNQANTSTVNVTGAVAVSLSDLRITTGTGTGGIGGGLKIGTGAAGSTPVVTTTNVVIDNNKAILGAGAVVFANATWNATSTTVSNNVASGTNSAGGGVYNNGTMSFGSGTITGNTAPLGGGVVNTSAGGTITGSSITGNTGSTQGGGIYNAGTLQVSTSTVSGNSSPAGAGAMNAGGTLTFGTAAANSGGSISGNTATSTGGGVHVAANTTVNINNATLATNAAPVGGGVYSVGTLNTSGATFNQNSSPFGGGIGMGGTANLVNSTFSSNTSSNQGGAIYNNTGSVTLNGTTLNNNSAVAGGGIFQQTGSNTVTNGSVITGNSATNGNGGGINNTAGSTTVTGSTISNNTASAQGGGIYSAAGTVTTTGATITGNSATTLGGGLTLVGGTNTITGGAVSNNSSLNAGGLYSGGATTIDGTTLTGNAANGGSTSNGGNAGAIYNSAALVVKNATFNGNKVVANTNATPGVTGYGGAIASFSLSAAGAPTLSFTNTTINGDNAGTPVTGGNANVGGAIAALGNIGAGGANTVITATGLTLSKNVALAAGGIYTTGSTTLTNSLLSANQATHASAGIGGGLYAVQSGAAPTITLDNTSVLANDGVAGGGGLVLGAGVSTVVKNGSLVSNNTGAIGAGIFTAGPVSIQGSHVDNNSASNSGGGIYSAAAVTLTGSSVNDNSAAFLGGGLSTTATAGSFTMTGGTVSGNDAYGAGGVFVGDSLTASFDDTDFIGNTSTGANFGGGAILSAGKLTVDHATLSGNTADGATGSGGAIYSGSSNENVTTTLKVSNSTITDNDSFVGSAVFAASSKASSTNKVSISSSTIHANTASGPFGAIETTAPTSIVGSTITDNTAVPTSPFDAYGGIVAQSAGQVSVSGSVVAGNNGHQCNVAVADGGYNLNSPTASECGFSAAKNDVFALPLLGALASNGGPTQTRLPAPASPALDKIPATTATGVNDAITGSAITLCAAGSSDQRGTSRPQGARCDIGAVEAAQIAPTVSGPANADYSVGNAGAPLTYTTTGSPQPTLSATGLPSGVTLHDNGDGTGTISGTPAAGTGGSYDVVVTATSEAGSATTNLTLVVHQAPTIGGPATATYTVGQAGGPTKFTQTTGHPLGIFSSIGALPSGVIFDDSVAGEGTYSGTPAAGTGGVYPLTVKDSNGTPPDATAPFTLTVNEAPSLTGPSAATFKVGTASSSTPDFVGTGYPVPTLSATGLPSGLSMVSTGSGTGKISGTAANGTGGSYPGVQVQATNGVGSPATKTVDVTVNEAPELTGPTEARFVAGFASSIGFSSDGYPVASITQTGKPSWLTFTDNGNGSASFSGTAPANAVGTYAITVTASNGQSPDAVIHLTLEVVPPLSISTTSLPNAAYRTAYTAQVTATGGQPAYSFQIVSGSLPAGLSMNSFGQITGAATAATGTFTFTVKATDSAQPAQTATKQLSITLVKGNTQLEVTPILLGVKPNGDVSINVGLVEADLKGGFPLVPIAGAPVVFKSGTKTVCTGTTNAAGHAQCSQSLLDAILTPLKGTLTATYAGNATWNPSSGSAPLIRM